MEEPQSEEKTAQPSQSTTSATDSAMVVNVPNLHGERNKLAGRDVNTHYSNTNHNYYYSIPGLTHPLYDNSLPVNESLRLKPSDLLQAEIGWGNFLLLPLGTELSLNYTEKSSGDKKPVLLTEGPTKNTFFALFAEDDVDFEIAIDNIFVHGFPVLDVAIHLKIQEKIHSLVVEKDSEVHLESLETNGGKLHFFAQSSPDGLALVGAAASKHRTSYEKASALISQIHVQIEYSKVEGYNMDNSAVDELRRKYRSKVVPQMQMEMERSSNSNVSTIRNPTNVFKSSLETRVKHQSQNLPNNTAISEPNPQIVGERGALCFGERSDQVFESTDFIANDLIVIEPFIIELRMASRYTLQ